MKPTGFSRRQKHGRNHGMMWNINFQTPRVQKTMLQSYLVIPWTTSHQIFCPQTHWSFLHGQLGGILRDKFPTDDNFWNRSCKRSGRDTPAAVLEAYFLLSLKVLLFWCVSSGGDEFGGYEHVSAHLCGKLWEIFHYYWQSIVDTGIGNFRYSISKHAHTTKANPCRDESAEFGIVPNAKEFRDS